MEKKERIFYLDFIRALSVIMIVTFHFNCSLGTVGISGFNKIFANFTNGDWGATGVILFFIISGVVLMHSNKEKIELKKYYEKRFLRIYPMFWIAYTTLFLYNFYCNKHIPYLNNFKLIISYLGMDGYLSYLIPNFYIIGEWFLGAIILIYILFPVLRYLSNRYPRTYIILLTILTILICFFNPFKIHPLRNIVVCIFSFSLGMYYEKYIKDIKVYQFLIAVIITIVIYFIKIEFLNFSILMNIFGSSLFIALVYISKFINIQFFKDICIYIGKYSYAIFLLHHYIIGYILDKFRGTYLSIFETCCLYLLCFTIILLWSKLLIYVTNQVINKIFKYKKEDFYIALPSKKI